MKNLFLLITIGTLVASIAGAQSWNTKPSSAVFTSGLTVSSPSGINYFGTSQTVVGASDASGVSGTSGVLLVKQSGTTVCPSNFSSTDGCGLILENGASGTRRMGMSIDGNYLTVFNFGTTLRMGGGGTTAVNAYLANTSDARWSFNSSSNAAATLWVNGRPISNNLDALHVSGTALVYATAATNPIFSASASTSLVGIGMVATSATLQVSGTGANAGVMIPLCTTSTSCAAGTAGKLCYRASNATIYQCDGANSAAPLTYGTKISSTALN